MIDINERQECCGCNACVQCCPKSCIVMREDEEGFLYPVVDKARCIDCGICEMACPVLNQGKERAPSYVYAAKNKHEEIRMQSSSGGIFTLLAEQILKDGGVVFGAKFNEHWEVVHDYTDNRDGLAAFRGSKYVQSQIGNTYQQARQLLKENRKVLFSGTPCQIAGLKLFLRREYENLLTVDFICHGVPSPMVWRKYLEELVARQGKRKNSVLSYSNPIVSNSIRDISRIEFRNKALGWKKFSFALTLSVPERHGVKNTVLLSEGLYKNVFLKGFLADLYLRPSCHSCCSKSFKSGSDITLGDCWGIQNYNPDFDDNKGVSLVFINTPIGEKYYNHAATDFLIPDQNLMQSMLYQSCKKNKYRDEFFFKCKEGSVIDLINSYTRISIISRIRQYAKIIYRILINRYIR